MKNPIKNDSGQTKPPDGTPPVDPTPADSTPEQRDSEVDPLHPNPPYTSKGRFTAPEFGAAGSGGAEYEPGPEKD